MIATNGQRITDKPTAVRPGGVRLDTILQAVVSLIYLWCVIVVVFQVMPAVNKVNDAADKRLADEKEAARSVDGARALHVRQQADLIEQQRRILDNMAKIEKQSADLNRRNNP